MDPYVYPRTDVLENLRGILDPEELARFEARSTAARLEEIDDVQLPRRFGASTLRAIHQFLFQDVYAWAGKFRTTTLAKAEYVGGPLFHFIAPGQIESALKRVLEPATTLPTSLERREIAPVLADLLGAINKVHPFREGNGRTQRAYLTMLAQRSGHQLYFEVVSKERMIEASVQSGKGQPEMLRRLFDEITSTERVEPLRRAIAFLEGAGFRWNDRYLSLAVSGRDYQGKLVGRDGEDCMVIDTRGGILIARSADLPRARATETACRSGRVNGKLPETNRPNRCYIV